MFYIADKPIWHNPDVDTFYGVIGSKTNLTCEARAEPRPTFEWFRGRTLIGNSPFHRILNGKWKSILQVILDSFIINVQNQSKFTRRHIWHLKCHSYSRFIYLFSLLNLYGNFVISYFPNILLKRENLTFSFHSLIAPDFSLNWQFCKIN